MIQDGPPEQLSSKEAIFVSRPRIVFWTMRARITRALRLNFRVHETTMILGLK